MKLSVFESMLSFDHLNKESVTGRLETDVAWCLIEVTRHSAGPPTLGHLELKTLYEKEFGRL